MSTPSRKGASSGLSRAALDFAPGLLAIQEQAPGRLPRVVLGTVVGLVGGLLVWSVVGRLSIIARAPGRLVPQTYVQIVQPAKAGIVQAILVHEGETVGAGQVLMRMDAHDAQVEEQVLQTEFALRSLQRRRIAAELTGHPLIAHPTDPPALLAEARAQYRNDREAYHDHLAMAYAALTKARRDAAAGEDVLAKRVAVTPLIKAQATAYASMGRGGYVPRMLVLQKQRAYLAAAQDLRAQRQTVASLKAAVRLAKQEVSEVRAKSRDRLRKAWVAVESRYHTVKAALVKQTHRVHLLALRAPQAGVVMDLATHTVGTVVAPGTVLVTLVPTHEPLMAQVRIKNADVGFVHEGQAVHVQVAAYPFQKYGLLSGKITYLSADATRAAPGRPGAAHGRQASVSTFKAIVTLKQQLLSAHGEHLLLVPGMQVVAEIHEGHRSVIDYLLSPVAKALHDSGHGR
ncbi:MAG: HlyD family type I secretion periplasmic adaptor subunit [Acidiferrobacter sp.]